MFVTKFLSPFYFGRISEVYRRLQPKEKGEWDSRCVSSLHAASVSVLSFISLVIDHDLWINPITTVSRVGCIALAISIGYMIADTINMLAFQSGMELFLFSFHHLLVAICFCFLLPIFIDIANRWSVLQNEMVFVSMLTNLMHSLQAFATRRQMRLTEETQMGFLHPGEVVYDSDRAGFCAWSIVRYRGLLIPCTPSIGVLRWKGKYYGFSSIQAAEEFEHAVEKFVFEISEVARRHPELIYVLQLQNMFSSGAAYFKDRKAVAESKRMFDFGIQTEVHPVESYIDSSYHWNEWELRRRALQMTTTIFAADEDIQKSQQVVFLFLHRKLNVREDGVELFFECQHLIPFDADGVIHIPSPEFRSVVSENQRLQPT
ncbi:nudix (nucleoside diphosphate linked moiety X)-type motif 8 [Sparganum proliferum]